MSTGDRNQEGRIGTSRRRTEDQRLLTGSGTFSSDFSPANTLHAAIVRAPHAHALIKSIDVSQAFAVKGVVAVLTGADVMADGLSPIPHDPNWTGPPDAVLRLPPDFAVYVTEHTILAVDKVRHVGEAVAMVVAETPTGAADAAELVDVDYEELPFVLDARLAMAEGAPTVWNDCAGNLALTCEVGDRETTDNAFERAAHVVKFDGIVNRVTGSPMEPRSIIGEYDAVRDRYVLRTSSGAGVVRTLDRLATVLGVEPDKCHVVFGDMGGNFGTRNAFYPEYALLPWAAKKVGRPVKWTATRLECFLSDYQARDLVSSSELALDTDGNFLGLRGANTMNLGAYTVFFWPLRKGLSMMQSIYRIPNVWYKGHAVLTNTMPTAVYRSAGRPEAVYAIERLIDIAADRHGFDRVAMRRRNLIERDAMPFTTAVGVTYDSGDYAASMDQVVSAADWSGFASRQQSTLARGRRRGIGIANYIEVTSGIPRECATISIRSDGFVDLAVGTMSSGQSHETTFPQLVTSWLGVPVEKVRFVANDSDIIKVGGGSHSGRSMRLVSICVGEAIEDLLKKATAIASQVLQASPDDIEYSDGLFRTRQGSSVDLWAIADAAATLQSLSPELRGELNGVGDVTNRAGGFPYGTHVCEVEVDIDTGEVEVVSWTGVDDVGLAVNPMVLHGQAHGAIAQGLGQALCEDIRYDADSGQLLTGSFMDYAMPRADVVPSMKTIISETPASSHPYGIRPGGEGGTTPALALLVSAVVDALSEFGVEHIDIPLTPERVWQAIRTARG